MVTIYTISFNIQQLFMLPTECIYGFRMIIITNSDYLSKEHQPVDLCMDPRCVFCEVGTEFLYKVCYLD
jgi:hypothetical protein